ncbi:hypothetical protein [Brevibacillus sp. FIR094]
MKHYDASRSSVVTNKDFTDASSNGEN